jgi:DNA-binding NarL/FixJ family response regulator
VLVIDDQRMVLDGLEAFLQISLSDLTLDTAADIEVAVRLAATVSYELVLLDWRLATPEGLPVDGAAVVEALRKAGSAAPIVVVSGDDSEDWPALLLQKGLSGFVPKSSGGSVLLDAIHVALRGGVYLPSQTLALRAQAAYRKPPPVPRIVDPRERFPELTPRQSEVLGLLVRGLSDKQIANELDISLHTAKDHVSAILRTIGVARRAQVAYEIRGGS